MRDNDLIASTTALIAKVKPHIKALADFALTVERFTELEESLAEFNALLGKPRNILNEKYVKIQATEDLFTECNDLLRNRIDKIMVIFKDDNTEFFDGYKRARTQVNA